MSLLRHWRLVLVLAVYNTGNHARKYFEVNTNMDDTQQSNAEEEDKIMEADNQPSVIPRKRKRVTNPRHNVLSASERKRRRNQNQRVQKAKVISIGKQVNSLNRWKELKESLGLTNPSLAEVLLDTYETTKSYNTSTSSTKMLHTDHEAVPHVPVSVPSRAASEKEPVPGTSGILTSTPATTTHLFHMGHPTPGMSEISAAESESEGQLSGVEKILTTDSEDQVGPKQGGTPPTQTRAARALRRPSASFLDPFNLTSIDITLQSESDCEETADPDDPEYEPSCYLEAILPEEVQKEATEVSFEEMFFGELKQEDPQEEEEEEGFIGRGIHLVHELECEKVASSPMALCSVEQVKQLALTSITTCIADSDKCGKPVTLEHSFVGSALYVKWVCDSGHVSNTWCSQPILNRRLHSGDFRLAMAIVTSGNNFGKIEMLGKHLNLKMLSRTSFFQIQGHYIVPTIDDFWKDHQTRVLDSIRNKEIVVLGDGRNDSPGYCAQYCTYTLMDSETKKILTIKTVDKRETDGKSPRMETEGFHRAMSDLLQKGINVKEVVTDAHTGIGAVMKGTYPALSHSHDIWHAAKNLSKKLTKLGSLRKHAALQKWTKDIVNHFWFTCRTATDHRQFVELLRGVLHHITGDHEWALGCCQHGELSESDRNKPWLDAREDSDTIKELANILLHPRLLSKVKHYLNFRSTADLEVFHQHILMYCAKRYAYTPPVYRIRNVLAALDHNFHLGRSVKTKPDGQIQYHRCFNKKVDGGLCSL
ncbi:uncharacterized protein [Littorina saxatilis]|uniref:uncharacterized protein n=1 Tax=Littorina saxatilis TaxID=31220 RepID=UPI0038B6AEBC